MIRPEAIPFIFESLPYVVTIAIMTFGITVNDNNVVSLKKNIIYLWHAIYITFFFIWAVGFFGTFNDLIPGSDKLVWSYAFSAAFGLVFIHKINKAPKNANK